ncbi:MAG: prepilin peptidase [Tepidanaerobacteraceae bacterium]|nr:prepilin peptidase [Tepidanaerobacteraceae bacterium]
MNLFIFILGTVIGSFINVCIYRIPRGESVVYPPSHCSRCGYHLQPQDLIPLLSYFWLRGRCRKCGARISMRYPLVEFLTGIMFLATFNKFGFTFNFLTAIILVICLIISLFIDLEHQIIPDKVVLPTMAAGLLINIVMHWKDLPDYLMGFALGGGIIFLIVVLSKGGMGGGDIKLFATVGMFLGLRLTVLAILLSFIFGSIAGLILIILKYKRMKDAIAFGPFIALGSVVSLFMGDRIISWYWGLFF